MSKENDVRGVDLFKTNRSKEGYHDGLGSGVFFPLEMGGIMGSGARSEARRSERRGDA